MYRILLFIPPIEGVDFFKDWNNIQSLKNDIVTIGEECLSLLSKQYGMDDDSADFRSKIEILFASDSPTLSGAIPTFVSFFSNTPEFATKNEQYLFNEARKNGAAIYPIAMGDDFFGCVPEGPCRYQGEILAQFFTSRRKKAHETARKKLTNLVKEVITNALHFFGLASARKVFISYCQRETADIACHLYEELQKRHYKPFLDKNALQPTVDFQAHLMHELADSDILILLDSGGNRESKWCQEEINAAIARGMAIIALTFWPCLDNTAALGNFGAIDRISIFPEDISCSRHNETTPPTCRGRLVQIKVQDILNKVDETRARAFASKTMRLKSLLEKEHSKSSQLSFCRKGCLLKFDDIIYKPIIGVPQAEDFYSAEPDAASSSIPYSLTYCSTGLLSSHIKLIDWLSDKTQLSVQELSVLSSINQRPH